MGGGVPKQTKNCGTFFWGERLIDKVSTQKMANHPLLVNKRFNLPLLSFSLYTTFKSGIAGSLFLRNRGGLVIGTDCTNELDL